MASLLANMILQTTNAPTTSVSCSLIAAPTGRSNFRQFFTSGTKAFYFLSDGTIWEAGVGTLTFGTPDLFSRDTVTSNSSGTTARLSFAGMTNIYNEIPAEYVIYKDQAGAVTITEPANGTATLTISAPNDVQGANIKLAGNGTTPSKTIRALTGLSLIHI